jgi:AcrR family transcriptional regulator
MGAEQGWSTRRAAGPLVVPPWGIADSPRDRIMAAACELFNDAGIRVVGVDAIIVAAGVARNTFYRYFPSKELLVVAFAERVDAEWRVWFVDAVTTSSTTASGRLLAVFGVLPLWFDSPTFRGSPVLNVAAEVGDSQPRIAQLARDHATFVQAFLADLVRQAGFTEPDELAGELRILFNGAVVTAQWEPDAPARRAVARHASRAAAALLVGAPRDSSTAAKS